jgi:hypothetical protein
VFPIAIPIEGATDPDVVTFTKKAPTKTLGHTCLPNINRLAKPMPVGGHTAVAL